VTDRRVLLDTGPLVALLAEHDAHHGQCVETFTRLSPPLLTCWPVLTEAAWVLRRYPRPADRLHDAQAAGLFDILPLHADDLTAIAEVMRRYEDAGLQLADAALAHLAERESIRTVFTTDRRDFSIIRLKRKRPLRIIPEVQ
jgi:uncharacterized protein